MIVFVTDYRQTTKQKVTAHFGESRLRCRCDTLGIYKTHRVLMLLAVIEMFGTFIKWFLGRPQAPVHALVIWGLVCAITHTHVYLQMLSCWTDAGVQKSLVVPTNNCDFRDFKFKTYSQDTRSSSQLVNFYQSQPIMSGPPTMSKLTNHKQTMSGPTDRLTDQPYEDRPW